MTLSLPLSLPASTRALPRAGFVALTLALGLGAPLAPAGASTRADAPGPRLALACA
jgi:hypothetical protein